MKISFRIKSAGRVFVAVSDDQGRMLRELARGMKLQPGQHHFFWGNLARYGKSATAGEYEWRLLCTPGFTREFLVNVQTFYTSGLDDLVIGDFVVSKRQD
jgi:hypothetical protein